MDRSLVSSILYLNRPLYYRFSQEFQPADPVRPVDKNSTGSKYGRVRLLFLYYFTNIFVIFQIFEYFIKKKKQIQQKP